MEKKMIDVLETISSRLAVVANNIAKLHVVVANIDRNLVRLINESPKQQTPPTELPSDHT